MYHVYVIRSGARRYVGKTNDLARRLRQHNGELTGGARATAGRSWAVELVIDGFEEDRHAMQAEWRLKRARREAGRGGGPVAWLGKIRFDPGGGWTSRAPPHEEQFLCARTDIEGPAPDCWPEHWGWLRLSR